MRRASWAAPHTSCRPPPSDSWVSDPAFVLPGRSSPGRDEDDGGDQEVEAATALLEALDGAITGARGGQDRAKALATMQARETRRSLRVGWWCCTGILQWPELLAVGLLTPVF